MSPNRQIRKIQKDWAEPRGLSFDSRGYLGEVDANLRMPLSERATRGFTEGAGSELADHMKALHSSSALVVNLFDFWTYRDKGPLLSAMRVDDRSSAPLDFEAQFPTGLGGKPPHLDIVITLDSGPVVAVESKFTEHLDLSTGGKSKFTASYFALPGGRWTRAGLPACQELAEELHDGRHRFEYLDPWQLLKHTLGLATNRGDRFSLRYLYYDFPGDKSDEHEQETRWFADRVGDEIRFKALRYQEVFGRLVAAAPDEPEYQNYLGYLETRYFPRG